MHEGDPSGGEPSAHRGALPRAAAARRRLARIDSMTGDRKPGPAGFHPPSTALIALVAARMRRTGQERGPRTD
jgi:hypothetical protein